METFRTKRPKEFPRSYGLRPPFPEFLEDCGLYGEFPHLSEDNAAYKESAMPTSVMR